MNKDRIFPTLSWRMSRNLEAIGKVDQHGWVRSVAGYTSPYDPLVKRGLMEFAMIEYQPPPRLVPHYRLTAAGRALMNTNGPPEGDDDDYRF